MGLFVDEAIGAGTRGGNPFMRRVRAALGSDAAILFALSSANAAAQDRQHQRGGRTR